eukprot:TRINITY_DN884_c0_g1_i1.p1 TRINITY_DN884_c0_g1~~TRINITY_DN884_c0_g1_i1.p1  ORF type:complete len:404 (+),score=81.47 TRINITY_DN884_c0_g1_i1:42-1214(+)
MGFYHRDNSMEAKKYEKIRLYTPGPLSTSKTVKEVMLKDFGSRDPEFIEVIEGVTNGLLEAAKVKPEDYQLIVIQGSGTYGMESVIGSVIPKAKHLLYIFANGAYGVRISTIAKVLGINFLMKEIPEDQIFTPEMVVGELKKQPDVTHVAIVHSETTSGLINPIEPIGIEIAKLNPNIVLIVDAISSFGAYVPDFYKANISYLVGSANKCIQGVPGFAYIFCKHSHLQTIKGYERSVSLSLFDQWTYMKKTKQFRFTPPTHVLRAFHEALKEFKKETQMGRFTRYSQNQNIISDELTKMGFKLYLPKEIQGCVITTFHTPTDSNYNFEKFYQFLAKRNMFIYPGKTTKADTFRIGSIGDLNEEDMHLLLEAIKEYVAAEKMTLPIKYQPA